MKDRNIEFYIDRARERTGARSDRSLCGHLRKGPNSISFYRAGKMLPSDGAMVDLARAAGIDPVRALIDLNIWRSQEPARGFYRRMLVVLARRDGGELPAEGQDDACETLP